jgi:hypothetical protein
MVNNVYKPSTKTGSTGRTAGCDIGLTILAVAILALMGICSDAAHAQEGWQRDADLLTMKAYFSLVTANGLIYAVGGATGNDIATTDMESYNPSTGVWTPRASLLTYHDRGVAALGSDGRIYEVGGYYENTTAEAYNPTTDTWTTARRCLQGVCGRRW